MMKSSLIPNFKGKRWLKISLRSIHLVGIAGVFATSLTAENLVIYWAIAILSGIGLLALEALTNLIWFIQIRALVMYVKFSLLVALFFYPHYAWHILVTIILISGLISHAPSAVRYFSFIHWRKITAINDIKG
ncbi:MAG: hypothetical protein OQK09_03285 [Colwellia sp.]|nr:hypothetical protein [Colwellia sp.]MCW8864892.1 hypothetical protein [Colwellia sp.]MCW9080510.1 hypothetical protein [Colwellia sp.]